MLKITYIYHDCFLLRYGNTILLFDYPEDINREAEEYITKTLNGRNLIVFISHSHRDHFTEKFLNFKKYVKDFKCVVSRDVKEVCKQCLECNVVEEGDYLKIGDIKVKAYGSSDLGVSYLLEVVNTRIYFAGDNVDWRREELSQEFNEKIWKTFSKTIEEILKDYGKVNIVFAGFCEKCSNYGGIPYIAEKLKPELIVPMHLKGHVELLKIFKNYFKKLETKVFYYTKLGDSYTYKTSYNLNTL